MDKICFYHDDLDGYCSAAIVCNYYNRNIILQKINHGEVEFLNSIHGYKEVIFVDFTPSLEYIEILSKNNEKLLILDHHKTAQDRFGIINYVETDNFKNVKMILDVNHAGCMVTWDYFNPIYNGLLPCPTPLVVKLVEDYDIWKWEYDDTENFVNGMDTMAWKNGPTCEAWKLLLNNHADTLDYIITNGIAITQYKNTYNSQLLEALSYEVMFQGHKILVINAPKNNSKVFGDRIKDYPFVAIYSHKEGQYMVSLYSANNFDTTTISTQMIDKNGNRGGGHAGASGFRCEELPWEIIEEEQYE